MIASSSGIHLDALAGRAFHIFTQLLLGLPRSRRRDAGSLKDMEFMALSLLRENNTLIVGDIQRVLGVLPAQMSRIIRSLESRLPALVVCHINPDDKRKVNVQLTPAGEKMLDDYIAPRVRSVAKLLARLSEEDRDLLAHLLERLQGASGRASGD